LPARLAGRGAAAIARAPLLALGSIKPDPSLMVCPFVQ